MAMVVVVVVVVVVVLKARSEGKKLVHYCMYTRTCSRRGEGLTTGHRSATHSRHLRELDTPVERSES